MQAETPPPHRLLSSTPIPTATAATILQSYLTHSEAHAHLHPDALITPTGVSFSSHGGPAGGVVMHNLRRVAAGLRGEVLEPEATPEPEVAEVEERYTGRGQGKGKGEGETRADETGGEVEWQDKDVYEREQGGTEIGEVGERTNVVAEGGEEPGVEASGKRGGEALDKEARKRAKKERDALRKREKEQKRKEDA
ncbi:uncharacterized protein M421DRAFT_419634 [Didymella exigua CBS 183.55]|uniref:Uncharacterized protein n=1 Tax=Didymella exigua CBS 183.55 TaxID=1150837 RepID=A0A6A5RX81_9PLEO|nr:uncharacterized protein M421DRAFT_419634 [Didymella exigua CBS 183.55]KAF1929867.1 hypothetical protein M421DRAFT_419634 [Didymella exigua CBS 183.55]